MRSNYVLPKSKTRIGRRHGSATVEFAVCAPLVISLLFGAIEIGRAVMVQHMIQEAAQAGCRLYSVSDATQADVNAIIEKALERTGIENYTVEFDPPNKADVDESLEAVTVVVSADYEDVGWIAPFYFNDAVISGSCTMPADVIDEGSDDST